MSIAAAFDQLQEVTSEHEPDPKLDDLAARRMNGEAGVQFELSERREKLPEHYVESALWNTWLVSDLIDLFPEAKFVWLQRDLMTWAYSAHRRGWYDLHAENTRSVSMKVLRPEPADGWQKVSRWFKLGWMYQQYTRQINRCFEKDPSRWAILNMRDLGDIVRLNGLTRWAGLPGMVRRVRHINKGDLYVSPQELMSNGLDATKFGEEFGWETPLSIHHLSQSTPWPAWKLESISKKKRTEVKLTIDAVEDLLAGMSWKGKD
jgi:hypothetical protein